ncbi:MAG: hypothetical protein E7C91_04430 [Veillonella sp.]|nr:hypothetical protein [Veillonella sp.]
MGYSVEDVKDVSYVPAEYKDFEWSEQGESGEVFYTGDPAAQLIRSITWTKDGMAYSSCGACKKIDSSRSNLFGIKRNVCNRSKRREYEENNNICCFMCRDGYGSKYLWGAAS